MPISWTASDDTRMSGGYRNPAFSRSCSATSWSRRSTPRGDWYSSEKGCGELAADRAGIERRIRFGIQETVLPAGPVPGRYGCRALLAIPCANQHPVADIPLPSWSTRRIRGRVRPRYRLSSCWDREQKSSCVHASEGMDSSAVSSVETPDRAVFGCRTAIWHYSFRLSYWQGWGHGGRGCPPSPFWVRQIRLCILAGSRDLRLVGYTYAIGAAPSGSRDARAERHLVHDHPILWGGVAPFQDTASPRTAVQYTLPAIASLRQGAKPTRSIQGIGECKSVLGVIGRRWREAAACAVTIPAPDPSCRGSPGIRPG